MKQDNHLIFNQLNDNLFLIFFLYYILGFLLLLIGSNFLYFFRVGHLDFIVLPVYKSLLPALPSFIFFLLFGYKRASVKNNQLVIRTGVLKINNYKVSEVEVISSYLWKKLYISTQNKKYIFWQIDCS